MEPVTRGAVVLIMTALFTVGVSWKAHMNASARLEAEVELINARFESMSAEHQKAMDAADAAIRARDEIYEAYQKKAFELENILSAWSDVSFLPLPDGLLEVLQGGSGSPASGIADGSDSDSSKIGNEDGR